MESVFFEHEIVDSLFLVHKDLILSKFRNNKKLLPPIAVRTTLARISLFPHLRIATPSLLALCSVVERNEQVLTHLPSPVFPSSSPHQQYSGLSFLSALAKRLRIVFTEFQENIPTDPSHLPKYAQLTKDDPYKIIRSLAFCSFTFNIPTLLLNATPPIEVDSEIVRELILFVKEAIPTILATISNIDTLIASLPSDSSPTTPSVSRVELQMASPLIHLRNECEVFVNNNWKFLANVTSTRTTPHKSTFQTIILDDPSFPDLFLNSLKLPRPIVRRTAIIRLLI